MELDGPLLQKEGEPSREELPVPHPGMMRGELERQGVPLQIDRRGSDIVQAGNGPLLYDGSEGDPKA